MGNQLYSQPKPHTIFIDKVAANKTFIKKKIAKQKMKQQFMNKSQNKK